MQNKNRGKTGTENQERDSVIVVTSEEEDSQEVNFPSPPQKGESGRRTAWMTGSGKLAMDGRARPAQDTLTLLDEMRMGLQGRGVQPDEADLRELVFSFGHELMNASSREQAVRTVQRKAFNRRMRWRPLQKRKDKVNGHNHDEQNDNKRNDGKPLTSKGGATGRRGAPVRGSPGPRAWVSRATNLACEGSAEQGLTTTHFHTAQHKYLTLTGSQHDERHTHHGGTTAQPLATTTHNGGAPNTHKAPTITRQERPGLRELEQPKEERELTAPWSDSEGGDGDTPQSKGSGKTDRGRSEGKSERERNDERHAENKARRGSRPEEPRLRMSAEVQARRLTRCAGCNQVPGLASGGSPGHCGLEDNVIAI